MLFNSTAFLFAFLPVVLVGFLALQRLGHTTAIMVWLTLCSLFFYGWWNPVYLLLILFSAAVNFSLARVMTKHHETGFSWVLAAGVSFNLGLLAYFKYVNFFLENARVLLGGDYNFTHIVLPLAISFYTFQQITYLVDTRKGLTKDHSILEYLLFVSFFPQLIAGPIVHHSEMLSQFKSLGISRGTARNLAIGLSILAIGLFKKVVIADGLAQYATPVFTMAAAGATLSTLDVLAGSFSYAFQLYFDFSGYSDMAIGLACLFGLKLPVNFYSPFRAQNISDFWRTWHASLSRFLRDYVYTPLGGFLCSPSRQRFNLFCTMFVGGIWHGAGWTFVVYGVLHGCYVVIHQLWRVKVSGPLELVGNRHYQFTAQILTFLVVVMSLIVFRSDSMTTAVHIFSCLTDINGVVFEADYMAAIQRSGLFRIVSTLPLTVTPAWFVANVLWLSLAACWILPNTQQLFAAQQVTLQKTKMGRPAVLRLEWRNSPAWMAFTALLITVSFMNLNSVSEFLYFQF
ncbi:MAG: alginate O-acetyltransferase complex protein AlgI [Halieaceae bacterium]|jgi:alginate O-acetyltransferase complex protein AlgI